MIGGWQRPWTIESVIHRSRVSGVEISRKRNVIVIVVVVIRRQTRVQTFVQLLLRSLLVQPIDEVLIFFDLGFRLRQLFRSFFGFFLELFRFLGFGLQVSLQLVLFSGERRQGLRFLLQRLLLFLRDLVAQF